MRKAETEKKEFLKICGERDKRFLTEPETMCLGDFDRLVYITNFLGYTSYNLELWNQVSPQYRQQFDNLEKLMRDCPVEYHPEDSGIEADLHDKWLLEFIAQVPEEKTRQRVQRKIQKLYHENGWELGELGEMP